MIWLDHRHWFSNPPYWLFAPSSPKFCISCCFQILMEICSRPRNNGLCKIWWAHRVYYRVFSLTWQAYMQIYWNKRKSLHKKRVQLPQDWFGTPTWPPFHCFGTPIWPPWRHVKTLYRAFENRELSLLLFLWSLFCRSILARNWSTGAARVPRTSQRKIKKYGKTVFLT